ncbi:MAG TPA: lipoyl(octanoyl) transferase LipB [Myxococcota bacterium]|nr:lipoyl(octanoyl) transferase LipB [Myxococcota bacterium]HRY96283.1 lipoyl(octanoyl) transferase LipB [Myxococcota bacterium]HSA22934.1 lipoyl(octanoyl) transferase LipB [Myxococcota bacterium]
MGSGRNPAVGARGRARGHERLEWCFLGRVDYPQALALQYAHAARVQAGAGPRLLLLEHPPTITLGRQADRRHLRLPEAEYRRRGVELFHVLRGGDVTYHGPGQLVGYPVASLERLGLGVPAWVEGIARALVEYLVQRGLPARWSELHPGVWVDGAKIAALGFHMQRRVSTHGFALNLAPALDDFEMIVPCGLANLGVTSMARLGVPVPPMAEAAADLAARIAAQLGWELGPALPAQAVLAEKADVDAVQMLR